MSGTYQLNKYFVEIDFEFAFTFLQKVPEASTSVLNLPRLV